MKQKAILVIILSLLTFMTIMHIEQNLSKAQGRGTKIPEDAIRLRILANSDSSADQAVKRFVRDAVNANVENWVRHLKTAKQAKRVIRSHLDDIRGTVKEKLQSMNLDETFTVTLGKADFPTKMYGGYVYPAGKYEALVVTLGKGKGANWWCVLFPPLCFLDFSNGDAVKPDPSPATTHEKHGSLNHNEPVKKKDNDVKVRFFVVDLFDNVANFFKRLFN